MALSSNARSRLAENTVGTQESVVGAGDKNHTISGRTSPTNLIHSDLDQFLIFGKDRRCCGRLQDVVSYNRRRFRERGYGLKCPNCGYWDRWRPGYNARGTLDYLPLSDFPEAKEWPIGQVIEKDGFAFWRSKRYVSRRPIEIFKVEGKNYHPTKGHWDYSNFDRGHHRKADPHVQSLLHTTPSESDK